MISSTEETLFKSQNENKTKPIMKNNMGSTDKMFRILFAVVVAVLYFMTLITGTAAIILGIFAIVFLISSFLNLCPLYVPLGIDTRKQSEK